MSKEELHKQLAGALGRIPSGLFVLTARRDQRETGMLASWVQQCGFEPPALTVALQRDRAILAWLTPGAPFTLNVLEDDQTDMIVHFGRGFALGEPAFEGLDVDRPDGGAPVLRDALAYLQCQVAGRCEAGDHEVFIGWVLAGRVLEPEGHPMIHVRRNGFHY
jgi:flavin reductase (DIM6/NTAB) family NADH-FMN oxidoreductase RutF